MVKVKQLTIKIPENVKINIVEGVVHIEGPKGILSHAVNRQVDVKLSDSAILIDATADDKKTKALFGLTRALLANAIKGVIQGYTKTLELSGVGFRASLSGDILTLSLGFSHPVTLNAPKGITFAVLENKVTVSGIDKQAVGQIAHTIRSLRPAEPYKGKGVRYVGERIRRKAGKAAAKTVGAK